MAASTTVFSQTPIAGIVLGATAVSTGAMPLLTRVIGNDGHTYIYGKASEAIGSITTCKVGNAGSVSDDTGSAGWTANCPGGAAVGQRLWLKRTTIA